MKIEIGVVILALAVLAFVYCVGYGDGWDQSMLYCHYFQGSAGPIPAPCEVR